MERSLKNRKIIGMAVTVIIFMVLLYGILYEVYVAKSGLLMLLFGLLISADLFTFLHLFSSLTNDSGSRK